MDLFDPANPRPVHFMGIGGAGMSALALVARRRGVSVTGCDPDPSGAADVAALGAAVFTGHDPKHVEGARAVVVTAAVAETTPNWLARGNSGFRSFRASTRWPNWWPLAEWWGSREPTASRPPPS